jgi:hypothetical protein
MMVMRMKGAHNARRFGTFLCAGALALASFFTGTGDAQAQTLSQVKLSRLQVRVKTCSGSNAQSSDRIYISFGSMVYPFNAGWAGGSTNAWKSWDVVLPLVATSSNTLETMGHIGTTLTIGKVGTDGWCLNQVEVYLNGWRDNGGPTVVDADALLFRSSVDNARWIDGDGGYSPTVTFDMASDTANFWNKPYFSTYYHSFALWGVQDMLTASFNHLTSPAGFLYGRAYGTPTYRNLPTSTNLSQWWTPFTFETALRAYATGTTTAISLAQTQIAIEPVQTNPLAPQWPLRPSAVTSSQELQTAVTLAFNALNTMIQRDTGAPTASASTTVVRTGGTGNTDYYYIALP